MVQYCDIWVSWGVNHWAVSVWITAVCVCENVWPDLLCWVWRHHWQCKILLVSKPRWLSVQYPPRKPKRKGQSHCVKQLVTLQYGNKILMELFVLVCTTWDPVTNMNTWSLTSWVILCKTPSPTRQISAFTAYVRLHLFTLKFHWKSLLCNIATSLHCKSFQPFWLSIFSKAHILDVTTITYTISHGSVYQPITAQQGDLFSGTPPPLPDLSSVRYRCVIRHCKILSNMPYVSENMLSNICAQYHAFNL